MKKFRLVEEDFKKYLSDDSAEISGSLNEYHGEMYSDMPPYDAWDQDVEFSEEDLLDEELPEEEMIKAIRNQLIVPEYNREYINFIDKKTGEEVYAMPMAQISDYAFLFKVGDKLKKYNIENIKFD